MNGGELISEVLYNQGVRNIFTLCGGHISPILIGAKKKGIKVIDVRNEADAVFAADAVSRLSDTVGVAAVTAGPGVTNSITALVNAYESQSPLILLGGAAATLEKGRGALQDIDQLSIIKAAVKHAASVKKLDDIIPTLEHAFLVSQSGVPGPVFIEFPLNVTAPESIVRKEFEKRRPNALGMIGKGLNWYIDWHLDSIFREPRDKPLEERIRGKFRPHSEQQVSDFLSYLQESEAPLMLIGSQTILGSKNIENVAKSVRNISVPAYLSGMARGLLGKEDPLQFRYGRKEALKEADLVILAGVSPDFRLGFGRHINRRAKYVSINLSTEDLNLNRYFRNPDQKICGSPREFLGDIGSYSTRDIGRQWTHWKERLRERENIAESHMRRKAEGNVYQGINPLQLFYELDKILDDNSVIIVDGGDFAATASYILRPRKPLRWLDPGKFGTLGVGGGFGLGAKALNPDSEVYIIYGDGSCAYSISEYDSFLRNKLPVIAIVGNDAAWTQIKRDQVRLLGDDVATSLRHTDYHTVAKGYGGEGRKAENINEFIDALKEAKQTVKNGKPYLINSIIGKTDFRDGSLSV